MPWTKGPNRKNDVMHVQEGLSSCDNARTMQRQEGKDEGLPATATTPQQCPHSSPRKTASSDLALAHLQVADATSQFLELVLLHLQSPLPLDTYSHHGGCPASVRDSIESRASTTSH